MEPSGQTRYYTAIYVIIEDHVLRLYTCTCNNVVLCIYNNGSGQLVIIINKALYMHLPCSIRHLMDGDFEIYCV